jgi:hypothetical protein
MGLTTFRQMKPERPAAAATYWRRRFVALLIGMSMLALVAWAFAGALGGSAPAGSPAATQTVHRTAPGRSAAAGASHGATAGHGGNRGAGAPVAGRVSAGTAPGRTTTTARHGLRPCPVGDVVLSLFSSQASYTVRQTPAFEVDVVSTASQTCTFDIGARHVLLQITVGKTHVWTSADCAEGQASLVTKLYRGVPTVVPIAWNGQRSSPGCPVPGAAAPAGSYTAVAADGSLSSSPLTFRIG